MPIISPPTTYTCPKCNWSKTMPPAGDARMPWEVISSCPRCANESLTVRTATTAEAVLAQVLNPLGGLFKR